MPDLQIRNLHVNADDKHILRGLDLEVSKGEIHALMGPNGSGKSTLANAIMGHPALDVTDGEIVFKGDDITEASPTTLAGGAVPGVPVPRRDSRRDRRKYLRTVINAHREARGEPPISLNDFRRRRRRRWSW